MPIRGRHRNIAFKLALVVMSVALAVFGILGWGEKANAFEALQGRSWAILSALWPLFCVAAVACLAAQVIAACAAVNFARLAKASKVWRGLAVAFYGVSVFFAAYSADMGAQVVLGSAHRSAYEARQHERQALTAEISTLSALIESERVKLPTDLQNVPAQRQEAALAIFSASTAAAVARLPEAQRDLASKPPLPREQALHWTLALGVFAIFLVWAILEPWGYALAERGREASVAQAEAPEAVREAPNAKGANVHWLHRLAAVLTLGWLSHFATALPAHASVPVPERPPEPIELAAWQDAREVAFSMRDRFDVIEIAKFVHRDKSTIYRWFRERDKKAKEEQAAA